MNEPLGRRQSALTVSAFLASQKDKESCRCCLKRISSLGTSILRTMCGCCYPKTPTSKVTKRPMRRFIIQNKWEYQTFRRGTSRGKSKITVLPICYFNISKTILLLLILTHTDGLIIPGTVLNTSFTKIFYVL